MAVRTIAADGSGDFTTLAAWWDSLPATLTEPEIAEIKGELVMATTYLPSKVTSATNYIELRAAPGHKHTGIPGTGARIIGPSSGSTPGRIIEGGCRHYRYINLELVSNHSSEPISHASAVTGATLHIEGCIFRSTAQTGTANLLLLTAATLAATIQNSLFISSARGLDSRGIGSLAMRNCTWWSTTDSLVVIAGSTTTITNCYAGRSVGTQQVYSNASTPTGSYNASSDTTATARFPTGSINSVAGSAVFENPAAGDFRLKAGAALIDVGTTISGLTTDIIGTTRPQGAAYDIGAFEYASGGPPPTPPSGTTTITDVAPGATSALVTYSYSAGDATGFEYRVNGGAAASIGASPATVSGLTASTTYSLEVRAINAAGAGAWSAVKNFTTEAEGPGNLPPSFDGPSIAAISATEGIALSALDVSSRFSDAESALTFSAVGSWPAGVTVSSAGVISGTPTTAGTYSGLQVRATDAGSLTADSNTFSITVAAAAPPSTITVTEPLKNNTGTLLANVSGVRVAVLEAATLAGVFETSGLTTSASGLLAAITDASITTGQQYHVVIKLADGSVGITGPITAS